MDGGASEQRTQKQQSRMNSIDRSDPGLADRLSQHRNRASAPTFQLVDKEAERALAR
jgi:hypothetical protein